LTRNNQPEDFLCNKRGEVFHLVGNLNTSGQFAPKIIATLEIHRKKQPFWADVESKLGYSKDR